MRGIKIYPVLLFLSILFVSYPEHALADGCFFYDVERIGNSAEAPNQRAIIIYNGKRETLVLQVKYSGNVEDFAWIVPIPTLPEENSISTENDSIFKQLHDWTQPRVYRIKGDIEGYGWGERGASEIIPGTEVQVWERLQVGPYEVAVLSGSSSQALISWLTSNGYPFPKEAGPVIDFYVQKKWYFLATRVQVQSPSSAPNSTYQAGLPALKMTFQTEKPVFPLRISELTSAEESEIELYVAAPHRMVCENYQTVAMDRDEVQRAIQKQIRDSKRASSPGIACACKRVMEPLDEGPEYDYEAVFRSKLASYNKPTFLVEYAGGVGHYRFNGYFSDYFAPNRYFWLTRFRSILSPSKMQDDVIFLPDPNGDKWLRLDISIRDSVPNPWSASVFGIFLLPLFAFKRIRRRHTRELLLAILLLIMATA